MGNIFLIMFGNNKYLKFISDPTRMFCFLTDSWNLLAHPKGESFASNLICQMLISFLSEYSYHFEAQHNPKELHWSALESLFTVFTKFHAPKKLH